MSNAKFYLRRSEIVVREMLPSDASVFYETLLSYGWHPQLSTYTGYFADQQAGTRRVFVAEYQGRVAGLCTLVLDPAEGPWGGQHIPEIVDLVVFSDAQRRGVGGCLLDAAEAEASILSPRVFLAVGLHAGYGPAQRIYARRGYVPDGSGVWYKGKPLEPYTPCVNDDDLLLFLSKDLRRGVIKTN